MTSATSSLPQCPAERTSIQISKHSVWTDNIWDLGTPPPGQKRHEFILNWAFEMPDGSTFSDPAWSDLREACKLYIWSLHVDPPPHARRLSAHSLSRRFSELVVFVRWMATHGYRSLADLDVRALDTFIDDTANRPSHKPYRKISVRTLNFYAQLLRTIYRQGQRYGELAIPEPRSAMQHTNPRHDRGSWPRTPDEMGAISVWRIWV